MSPSIHENRSPPNHKPLLCRLTFKLPDSSYSGLESIVVGLSQAPDIGIVTKVWYARKPSPRVFHHPRTKLLRELSAKAFDIDIGSLESHEHDSVRELSSPLISNNPARQGSKEKIKCIWTRSKEISRVVVDWEVVGCCGDANPVWHHRPDDFARDNERVLHMFKNFRDNHSPNRTSSQWKMRTVSNQTCANPGVNVQGVVGRFGNQRRETFSGLGAWSYLQDWFRKVDSFRDDFEEMQYSLPHFDLLCNGGVPS